MTLPLMRALMELICPSICASSVDSYVFMRFRTYEPAAARSITITMGTTMRATFRRRPRGTRGRSSAVSAILLHLHEFSDSLLGRAQRPRQRHFRQVVGIQRGNQIVIRAGHRFLRLHHFDGVGHSGGESV